MLYCHSQWWKERERKKLKAIGMGVLSLERSFHIRQVMGSGGMWCWGNSTCATYRQTCKPILFSQQENKQCPFCSCTQHFSRSLPYLTLTIWQWGMQGRWGQWGQKRAETHWRWCQAWRQWQQPWWWWWWWWWQQLICTECVTIRRYATCLSP